MSRLLDALKRKYKTPEAALEALGLDVSLLRSAVTGDSAPTRPSRKSKPRLAYDADPDKQFEREQLAGPDEDDDYPSTLANPELAKLLREMGLDDEQIERACAAASNDQAMSCDDAGIDGRLAKLREYLEKNGTLADAEIEEALEHARAGMGEDIPPDLPSGGRPTPGGELTPRKNGGAMDAYARRWPEVARIQIDNSIGVQSFGSPTPQSKQARRQLATDAARSNSARVQASFFARFPDAAKIGQA
jgi:hypothetical protein